MIPDSINRVISSISAAPPDEILAILETLPAHHSFERTIVKAASHGLKPHLSHFSIEQLIKISHIYLEADSTASTLFTQLLDEYKGRLPTMSRDEVLALFALADELDSFKAKRPPNQIIIQFLCDLQELLFQQLKNDGPLVTQILSEPIHSITLLEMLIRLNVPKKKLAVCQQLFAKAKPHLLSHYHADEALALHAFIFYCRILSQCSRLTRKKNFYKEPFYQSTAAKVQWASKQFALLQLCVLVESCAVARIRDTSLLRTIARAVMAFEEREVLGNMHALIRLLDSYAVLNIPDSRIFDLLFKRIVTNNLRPAPGHEELTALHATALFGATGASKRKVSCIVASLSPHVVTPTNSGDLLKLELIRLFCRALFPKLPPLLQSTGAAEHIRGHISPVQQKVSDFLTSHGIENECEAFIEDYPYPVDIVIRSPFNVVIEVDGPHHYDVSGTTLLGKDCLKNVLISQRWRLFRIEASKVNGTSLQRLLEAMMAGPSAGESSGS